MKTEEQKIKETIENLPKEFIKLYNISIDNIVEKKYFQLQNNSFNFPFPTDITNNGITITFRGDSYSLSLWIESKIIHFVIF